MPMYKVEVATKDDSFFKEYEAPDMFDVGIQLADDIEMPDLDDSVRFLTIIKLEAKKQLFT